MAWNWTQYLWHVRPRLYHLSHWCHLSVLPKNCTSFIDDSLPQQQSSKISLKISFNSIISSQFFCNVMKIPSVQIDIQFQVMAQKLTLVFKNIQYTSWHRYLIQKLFFSISNNNKMIDKKKRRNVQKISLKEDYQRTYVNMYGKRWRQRKFSSRFKL